MIIRVGEFAGNRHALAYRTRIEKLPSASQHAHHVFHFAFPYDPNPPTELGERFRLEPIAIPVGLDLL